MPTTIYYRDGKRYRMAPGTSGYWMTPLKENGDDDGWPIRANDAELAAHYRTVDPLTVESAHFED